MPDLYRRLQRLYETRNAIADASSTINDIIRELEEIKAEAERTLESNPEDAIAKAVLEALDGGE